MRNKFFMACVAVIVFILMLCTIVGCNTTNESTDRLEKAIKEEEDNNNSTTIINNYNDNSITTNNNITNSYNTDTDDKEEVKEADDDKVVKVYVTEGTIVDDEESDEEEYREYNDYNADDDTNDYDTITPIGDLKNDMDPDPNVVHIKNIKCPKCGAYSYIEHYNLKDENLLFYMGTCNSCGYER